MMDDDFLADDTFPNIGLRGDFIHHIEHGILHDCSQPPSPLFSFDGFFGNGHQGPFRETKFHILELEEFLVLFH